MPTAFETVRGGGGPQSCLHPAGFPDLPEVSEGPALAAEGGGGLDPTAVPMGHVVVSAALRSKLRRGEVIHWFEIDRGWLVPSSQVLECGLSGNARVTVPS